MSASVAAIGADDHLGRLAGRREAGRRLEALLRVGAVLDRATHVLHRPLDPAAVLLGREAGEAGGGGQLDVDRDAVGMDPGEPDQLGIGVGDGLEVDVAAEIMVLAKAARHLDHLLHRIVGASG